MPESLPSPATLAAWEATPLLGAPRRALLGATRPSDSAPGSIRGDFATDVGRNVCHGSDSVDSANKELAMWFPEGLNAYKKSGEEWIIE